MVIIISIAILTVIIHPWCTEISKKKNKGGGGGGGVNRQAEEIFRKAIDITYLRDCGEKQELENRF